MNAFSLVVSNSHHAEYTTSLQFTNTATRLQNKLFPKVANFDDFIDMAIKSLLTIELDSRLASI